MKRRNSNKRRCKACGQKRAIFHYHGRVKADDEHELCPRCYRAMLNRLCASQLAAA